MIRRSFLQLSGITALLAVAPPALAASRVPPLPEVKGTRLTVTLTGTEHPLEAAHAADMYAGVEHWDHKVEFVFLSPKRMQECLKWAPDYVDIPSELNGTHSEMRLWNASFIEADIPDDVVILESLVKDTPWGGFEYPAGQPLDLTPPPSWG